MKTIARPFAGFLSAIAGSLLVVAVFHLTLWGKDAPPNIKVSSTPIVRDVKLGTSFAPIVKKAAPSVVNIYSTRTIPPNSMLIFEVELLSVQPAAQPAAPAQPLTSDIIKVPSAEEMKKGAKIETLKPEDVQKLQAQPQSK